METIGVILMVGGFLLGVFGGLTLSRREAVITSSDQVDKGKQFKISIITAASALSMLVGFLLYFGGL